MSDPLFDLQDRLSRLPIPERHAGALIRDDLRSAIGVAVSDSVSCAIRARRVVEHVVRDVYQRRTGKSSGTQPLEGVLAKVVKDGYFPEELAGFVHAIKGLANRAAHDTNRSYPVEYLVPALDQALLILEWYFDHERWNIEELPATADSRSKCGPPAAPRSVVNLAIQSRKLTMSCSVAICLMFMVVGLGLTGLCAYRIRMFASAIPAGYKTVAGTKYIRGHPEKVFRESDRATFTLWADGIYLPDGYSAVDRNDLVDGWPRRIKRDGVDNVPIFIRIPGNKTWMMGAWDAAVADSDRVDVPAHSVVITSGFYTQEKEVTNGEMEDYFNLVQGGYSFEWRTEYDAKKKYDAKTAREHPAANISHQTATDYARSVSAMLPTEAQWEYAARSMGAEKRFVWGNRPIPDETRANVHSLKSPGTALVGSYPTDVTLQGLLDMTGNVKEMCRDVWERYPKTSEVARDPCVTASEAGANAPPEFVIRGGDFTSFPEECTTTFRDDRRPNRDKGYPGVGFRLVIECPDARPSRPAH